MPPTTSAALGGTASHAVPVAVRLGGGRGERSFRFRTERLSRGCAQQHTRGLVGALTAEWRRIAADPAAHATVADWSSTQPALAGCADPAAVVDAVTRRGRDEVLLTLLRLAGDGDVLAARIALQVMLGSAVRLARRTLGHAQGDLEESLSRSVTALWQVIRDYPLQRRGGAPGPRDLPAPGAAVPSGRRHQPRRPRCSDRGRAVATDRGARGAARGARGHPRRRARRRRPAKCVLGRGAPHGRRRLFRRAARPAAGVGG